MGGIGRIAYASETNTYGLKTNAYGLKTNAYVCFRAYGDGKQNQLENEHTRVFNDGCCWYLRCGPFSWC